MYLPIKWTFIHGAQMRFRIKEQVLSIIPIRIKMHVKYTQH